MSDTEATFNADMAVLVERTVNYYRALCNQGIPEALAVRIVGDWYNGCVTVGVSFLHGRLKAGSDTLTRKIVHSMGRERAT